MQLSGFCNILHWRVKSFYNKYSLIHSFQLHPSKQKYFQSIIIQIRHFQYFKWNLFTLKCINSVFHSSLQGIYRSFAFLIFFGPTLTFGHSNPNSIHANDAASSLGWRQNTKYDAPNVNKWFFKLPTTNLPTFPGLAILICKFLNNEITISNVRRLHYLKITLKGESFEIIANLQVRNNNVTNALLRFCFMNIQRDYSSFCL